MSLYLTTLGSKRHKFIQYLLLKLVQGKEQFPWKYLPWNIQISGGEIRM